MNNIDLHEMLKVVSKAQDDLHTQSTEHQIDMPAKELQKFGERMLAKLCADDQIPTHIRVLAMQSVMSRWLAFMTAYRNEELSWNTRMSVKKIALDPNYVFEQYTKRVGELTALECASQHSPKAQQKTKP